MKEKKRKFQIPHTNVILFFMVAICAILTHIVPAGTFERAENAAGRIAVVPGSYHHVEQAGLSFFDTMKEFMLGMQSASDIIFFIFIFGGALAIIRDTGALDAGVHNLAKKLDKRKNLVLVIFMFLFSILGGTIGMAEDAIVYIPILITLCKQFKLDNIRNVGQKLYKFLTVKDAESLKTVCTFGALTFSFALGAVPGTLFCLWLSEKAVWICAVILLLLALWMKKASNYIS